MRRALVDVAVIEAGRLDDPRDAARGEFLDTGPKGRPPFAHRPANAVLFHMCLQARAKKFEQFYIEQGSADQTQSWLTSPIL